MQKKAAQRNDAMPVKFLHTADWQMGMKALQAGEKAKEVRSKRYETAGRIMELAKREAVDFVVLAGDLFEHHDVDEAVLRKTVTLLDSFGSIPVFVLPGNHDPLVAGGVWDRQSWRRVGAHVTLLGKAKEILVSDGVAIYPSPLYQKQSGMDPTEWIPSRAAGDDRIRIGIAHGSLDLLPERSNFPIASRRADETGLDYLALGDWHGFLQHGKAVYSGTMEQTNFSEKDPGNVAIVKIAHAGDEPVISKQRVGELVWSEHRPTIHDVTDVEQLRIAIRDTGALAIQLIRVAPDLEPDVSDGVVAELESLRKELLEEAFLLDWPEETVNAPLETAVSAPDGVLADVDSCLAAILEGKIPEGPGREAASADSNVVKEARALLRRLAREVAR
jgi:DNA repair exonuclease SbcCD nuclease subunit